MKSYKILIRNRHRERDGEREEEKERKKEGRREREEGRERDRGREGEEIKREEGARKGVNWWPCRSLAATILWLLMSD